MPGMRTSKRKTEPELPPRQRLLQAVLHGEMTPADAEAEAARLGLRALLAQSDPAVFDPMQEDHWTLAMTIAWIVWRTPDVVRENWDSFVIRCQRWREVVWNRGEGTPTYKGFEPGPLPTPCWPLLALREDYPRERTRAASWRPRSPHDAREELWKALQQGDIEADAIDIDTRRRVDIPAAAWKQLDLYPEPEWDIVRESPLSRSGYEDIRFPRRQVVDAWPDRVLSETLPPLVVPEGSGYMTLSAAALWIATQGGTFDVGRCPASWDKAYRKLTERIAVGEVEATAILGTTGILGKMGQRQKLEPALFGAIRIYHLFGSEEIDDADSDELYLWASQCLDDEHWDAGFGDDLRQRRRIVWRKVLVNKADVAKWWPFELVPMTTGLPGRPTSAHLFIPEFELRCAGGKVARSLAVNARALCEWLKETHPLAPQPGAKSVAERIRTIHNAYWAGRRK